jgi:hypothetical protein
MKNLDKTFMSHLFFSSLTRGIFTKPQRRIWMLKPFVFLIAGLTLAACQMPTETAMTSQMSMRQISTQSDMSAIIGKTLTFGPRQSFVISDNGTLRGSWDDMPLIGTYEMRDGFFCRTLSAGPSGPSPEDCQLLILDGANLMGTRDRGNGASFTYTVS